MRPVPDLISTLSSLVRLTSLDSWAAKLNTLSWCSALLKLTELCMSSASLTSLQTLPAASKTKLVVLNLSGCKALSTLEHLGHCPELAILSVEECTSLAPPPSLPSPRLLCPKLTKLYT